MSTIVVKLGGEVVTSDRLDAIASDLATLSANGYRVVVSHGAGPQISALSERFGITPRIVGGRRITDGETLEVVKLAVLSVNASLTSALKKCGARPVGVYDAIAATKRPPRVISGAGPEPIDLGHVGDVTAVDTDLLATLLDRHYLPVLACLGTGTDGARFNINADIVANQLARALSADALLLVTSTPGVLRDAKDPTTRIARLTASDARAAIIDGTITGGMIPKIEESLAAIADGVHSIVILGDSLAAAITTPGSVGTTLVA